ncbi:MAG: aldo/keto reductase, partial [Pseudobdellovibrionaceae bacterium]
YGIANSSGKPDLREVSRILCRAYESGVELLDTASAYGESESVLGELKPITSKFKIVTKIPALTGNPEKDVRSELEKSLLRLKTEAVDVVLFHSAQDLLSEKAELYVKEIETAQKEGLCKKWGVSVYDEAEAKTIYSKYSYSAIQLPLNLFDQRWVTSGALKELKSKGVEIHARSLFLQGLLVSKDAKLPVRAQELKPHLEKYFTEVRDSGLSMCLAYAKSLPIDYGLVGVEKESQLFEILEAFKSDDFKSDWSDFAWNGSRDAIDPRKWSAP